jgi:hypothetical protein
MKEKKSIKVEQWQLRVRDIKKWDYWTSSQVYSSFDELLAASKDWLQANPNRIIQFYRYYKYENA